MLLAGLLCSCNNNVTIALSDPDEIRTFATWAQFSVFEGGCPSEQELADGTFPEPKQSSVVSVDESLPEVGTLPAETYGFSVILRDDNCAIVGFGCVKADLTKVRTVNIRVNPTYTDDDGNLLPEGACQAPDTCQQGVCTSESGEGGAGGSSGSGGEGGSSGAPPVLQDFECKQAPSGPSDCKLELMAQGALPAPASGSKVGAPSVIEHNGGFVVGYHEMLAGGSQRVFRAFSVDSDGCNGSLAEVSFNECVGTAFNNFETSLGGSWSDPLSEGLFAFTRRPCPSDNDRGGGIGMVRVSDAGEILQFGVLDSGGDNKLPSLSFSNQYAISNGLGAEEFRVIYTESGQIRSFPIQGVGPGAAAVDNFFQKAPDTPVTNPSFAVQARRGTLAVQAAGGELGGAPTTVLRIATNSTQFVQRPAANQAALRLLGDRIVLMSRSNTDGVGWALLGSDGAQLSPKKTAPEDPNTVTVLSATAAGFDLAVGGQRAFFVLGGNNSLELSAVAGLDAEPIPGNSKQLSAGEVPSLDGFDGQQLAAAATGNRVIVAWTQNSLSSAGGVAVFKCE